GDANAEQVQGGHLLQYGRIKLLFLIPFLDMRRDFLLRKLAHRLHERLVIFSQFKIDHVLTLSDRVLKMTGHLTEGHIKAQKPEKQLHSCHLCNLCLFVAILRDMPKKNQAGDVATVGLVQMSCDPKPETNLKKAIAGINDAAKRGAQIVCLQELFRSQYFCQTEDIQLFKLAETIPGPSTEALGKIARQRKVVIVASLFEKRAAGVYHNTAVIIDVSGKVVGKYRKMHIPDDPLYYEKFYFTPGDLGFRTHDTTYGKIGTLVCWDQWFPEAARLTALGGAQFLFYPTAIGWLPDEEQEMNEAQHSAWETIQRGHAIAN